jgi:hypothetical protein
MSVELNRPPKPEESQKNSNFNGKPYITHTNFGTQIPFLGSRGQFLLFGTLKVYIFFIYIISDRLMGHMYSLQYRDIFSVLDFMGSRDPGAS